MNMQQLKAANPIERVAARYGTLLRSGANYKMLCPFHDDHHPSLGIHVGGQYFKCHACGAGGDVVGLVMGLEHCSFAEAVKRLGGDSRAEAVPATRNVQERTKQTVPEPTPEATPEQVLVRKQGMEANVRFYPPWSPVLRAIRNCRLPGSTSVWRRQRRLYPMTIVTCVTVSFFPSIMRLAG